MFRAFPSLAVGKFPSRLCELRDELHCVRTMGASVPVSSHDLSPAMLLLQDGVGLCPRGGLAAAALVGAFGRVALQ